MQYQRLFDGNGARLLVARSVLAVASRRDEYFQTISSKFKYVRHLRCSRL
jgi:hypothetical protein